MRLLYHFPVFVVLQTSNDIYDRQDTSTYRIVIISMHGRCGDGRAVEVQQRREFCPHDVDYSTLLVSTILVRPGEQIFIPCSSQHTQSTGHDQRRRQRQAPPLGPPRKQSRALHQREST